MKHTLRVLTVLLLSSTSVLAQGTCGQTQCPTTYKNLYCYDAGSKNKGRVQFKAKICLVEEGGVISLPGDLIATVEMGDTWGNEAYIANVTDCGAIFYGGDALQNLRTGVVAFEVGHYRARPITASNRVFATHYIIKPQLKASDRQAFRQPTNIRQINCQFGNIDER
jgi:hypothetical protein